MPNTPNIAVTLGWLSAAALQKAANVEEMIVRGLRSQAEKLPKEGILDLWYDMNNRKARLNAGDWADSGEIQQWKTMLLENEWVDSESDIELLDEAGGPGAGDWIKISSSHGVDIRESEIAGRGLFATRKYEPGDILVASYITKQNTDDPRTRWEQSDFARYTNHADKPNAYVRKRGETCELVAEGNLSPNEEITVNYRDVTAEIGKAFFFTYCGKSYGNDADAVSFMQKTSAYKKANFYGLPVCTTQELTGDELAVKIAEDGSQKQALSKLQAGLLGAGLGGAVGGVTDWATKDEYADDYNPDSTIDGILGGALLGGTAGVIGHGLYTGWNNIQANRGRAAKQDAEWRKRYSDTGNQTDDTGTRARSYNEILDAYLDPLKRPKPPAGSKTISLADVLPPGYREKAQQYAEKYRASGNGYFESDNPWHQNISDAAITRKVPTYSLTKEELANAVSGTGVAGDIGAAYEYPASANNGNERILLPAGNQNYDVIGHELTHSAQRGVLPNDKEFHARPEYESAVEQLIRKSNKYRASNHQGPISNTPGATANYLTNPHEEEAYLAEIKRNYWKATGKHVTNQASARAALDWLREQPVKDGNPLFDVLLKDDVYKDKSESSLFRRLMGPEVNENDPDRESWIKGLIQRMPGLVNNIRKSPVKNAAASIVQNYKIARTTDDILQRILKARAGTATDVSEGNAAAGNYKKGRFKYHGLKLSIENPKGSTRSGTAADGKKWSTKMKYDYGYIRETMGADGDPVDVFMGDDPRSELVFIINQNDKGGKFDEHKVVLGAMDARQAKQTYLANYEAGWTGCGSVVGMTMPQFKDWLKNGDIKKPAGEIKQAGMFDKLNKSVIPVPVTKPTRIINPYMSGSGIAAKPLQYNEPLHAALTAWEANGGMHDPDAPIPASLTQAVRQYHMDSGHEEDYSATDPDDLDLLELLMEMEQTAPDMATVKQAADTNLSATVQPKRTRVVMPYDGGYLMERMNNPKYPANLGKQRFPGGGIDSGETAQQAAARELMEELGLSVKPEQLRSMGIHANADHGPEEYFELPDHGIQPGNYTASVGGDKHIELIKGLLNSPQYWGAQLNDLQQPATAGAGKAGV